jgi:hypothetical protein
MEWMLDRADESAAEALEDSAGESSGRSPSSGLVTPGGGCVGKGPKGGDDAASSDESVDDGGYKR